MSKAQKEAVKKMKPSAYKSMLMGKLGMTKSSPSKKQDLLRWGSPTKGEKWINLTATYITDKDKEYPCGQKGKKQKDKGLPSVCRPKKRVNAKTPTPLAGDISTQDIMKAINKKKKGERIDWQLYV
jgi:hypothetical protein